MRNPIELAIRLFSPRGALHDTPKGNGGIGRDDIIGAMQYAAKNNRLGLAYVMADNSLDSLAVRELATHFNNTLGSEEAGNTAMAILLRRPLPEQLDRLILSHPHYDKERRRAAVVMEQAKRAHRAGNRHEYQRLLAERNAILSLAHDHCAAEMLQSGRCPCCMGTGTRHRKGDECPKCHGTGRVSPDIEFVTRRFGRDMRQAIEWAVDDVLHQVADLTAAMRQQVREFDRAG